MYLLSLSFLFLIQPSLLLISSLEDVVTNHSNRILKNQYNETIIFTMILYSSPYNLPISFQLCQHQRLSDAITDFMLTLGMHNENLLPWPIPYQKLWNKICNFLIETSNIDVVDMSHILSNYLLICREDNQEIKSIHQTPSNYISDLNKYITLYLPENETFIVYLRQGNGYTSNNITNCVCSKILCAADDYEILVSFISQYLSSP